MFLEQDNPIKTAIHATNSDLFDLKTIRNTAAHISTTTLQKLDSVASRLYGRQMVNTKVAEVIYHVRTDGKTQRAYLKDLLDVAAENVANGIV